MRNPLAEPQREKAGSQTFDKYDYQYHWALCRMINEYDAGKNYALFVEYHEDVVLADSIDHTIATFEFNQVKNLESKSSLTLTNLTSYTGNKNSIIGKIVKGAVGKPFSDKISAIKLVATCGFNLGLEDEGMNLEIIGLGDLTTESVSHLRTAIIDELGDDLLPPQIQFVISDLTTKGYTDAVVGRISSLIEKILPNSQYNPIYIYRSLIDELHRKGKVTYDYNNWDDLLDRKALTSERFAGVIHAHTNRKNDSKIRSELESVLAEIGYGYLHSQRLRQAFERYYTNRVGNPTSLQLNITKAIDILIKQATHGDYDISVLDLIQYVELGLDANIKSKIGPAVNIRAAIICELIMGGL